MKYTRLYTGKDNKTHFEDVDLTMASLGNDEKSGKEIGKISEMFKAKDAYFVEAYIDFDWHNSSCKQFVILLEGSIEIETGLGEKRIFNPGDIILADDLEGEGHITRKLGDIKANKFIAIPLA